MNFFDIDPTALPPNCLYYFCVELAILYISETDFDTLPEGVDNCWDISKVCDARPKAFAVYRTNDLDEGRICDLEVYDEVVIEVNQKTHEVAWYPMCADDLDGDEETSDDEDED